MQIGIAQEIANQIGRRAFVMMGAKDLIGFENGLSFRIGRNAKSVTHVKVTLDPSDTYTVRFVRARGSKVTEVASVSDVYFDNLHEVIEHHTGLYLSL